MNAQSRGGTPRVQRGAWFLSLPRPSCLRACHPSELRLLPLLSRAALCRRLLGGRRVGRRGTRRIDHHRMVRRHQPRPAGRTELVAGRRVVGTHKGHKGHRELCTGLEPLQIIVPPR